jgi:hypothetical protein
MTCLSKLHPTHFTRQRRLMLIAIVWLAAALMIAATPSGGTARRVRAMSQDPYPAPQGLETAPQDTPPTTTDGLAQPYPAPTTGDFGIIGDSPQAVPAEPFDPDFGVSVPVATAPAQQSSAGLYFLWGSFLAALFIFATAIVGSVVLFTRRVE